MPTLRPLAHFTAATQAVRLLTAMKSKKQCSAAILTSLAGLLSFALSCEKWPPKRPANVPASAVFASGGKVGWWHYCELSTAEGQAHCTIWNMGGLVLQQGVFLPQDRRALTREEIKVIDNPRWGDNAEFINLQNGRVLIPASDFDRLSRFAEWLEGRRSSP